jgi:hypothetical protein
MSNEYNDCWSLVWFRDRVLHRVTIGCEALILVESRNGLVELLFQHMGRIENGPPVPSVDVTDQ